MKRGEPVTDIYMKCINEQNYEKEIKLNVKQDNAEFLVNKTNAETAQYLFGNSWEQVIKNSTKKIEKSFSDKKLIHKKKFGRTDKGSIILGWKFEIMLGEKSGNLSAKIHNINVFDILTGNIQSNDERRNAIIDKKMVKNSGIANYIIFGNRNNINSLDELVEKIMRIEKYVKVYNPVISFACKALNYRTIHPNAPKWDGNRPLAVYVDWKIKDKMINAKLNFNNPLSIDNMGNNVASKLSLVLNEIGVKTTDDLNTSNVMDYENIVLE